MKVDEGFQRSERDHDVFSRKYEQSQRLEQEQDVLLIAKGGLEKAIEKKIVNKHYLESVVDLKYGSFPMVTDLMKRCTSLENLETN